jgi:hypothetical protein
MEQSCPNESCSVPEPARASRRILQSALHQLPRLDLMTESIARADEITRRDRDNVTCVAPLEAATGDGYVYAGASF